MRIICLFLLLFTNIVSAKVYRCIGESGGISYQQLPCNGVNFATSQQEEVLQLNINNKSKKSTKTKKKQKRRSQEKKIEQLGVSLIKNSEKQELLCLQLEEKIHNLEDVLRNGYDPSELSSIEGELRLAKRTFARTCK